MIKKILGTIRSIYRKLKVIFFVGTDRELKLIIGAASTNMPGWLSTDETFLDLTNDNNWSSLFKKSSIDSIFAEHVWEHLTEKQALIATNNSFEYLKSGGVMRIAVPDGFHPSEHYIQEVKPGGTGSGAYDHKVLYTYKELRNLFKSVGFEVRLLEYFDENSELQTVEWSDDNGKVLRSVKNDVRNQNGQVNYSSVIIDAIKS